MLRHPFASWVPLDGPATAWRDTSPWALCFKLVAVGHSTAAPSDDAQLLHPGSRTLLLTEDEKLHCEYLLCKREAFSRPWLWQRPVVVPHSFSIELPRRLVFSRLPSVQVPPVCRGTERTAAGPRAGCGRSHVLPPFVFALAPLVTAHPPQAGKAFNADKRHLQKNKCWRALEIAF